MYFKDPAFIFFFLVTGVMKGLICVEVPKLDIGLRRYLIT